MNIVKYRPVGMSGPIVRVRVYQKKKAMYRKPQMPSVAAMNKMMNARRMCRAGGRFK